jgi:thiol-disulfide isomerase/thioredoxin
MKTKHLVLAFLLIFTLQVWGDFAESFTNQFKSATASNEQRLVINKFLKLADSTEDHRIIQQYWSSIDKESCLNYYRDYYQSNKNEAKATYLWARLQVDKSLSNQLSRDLIKKHPDFYWSYRIITARIFEVINENPEKLNEDELQNDLKLFQQGFKKFPKDPFNVLVQFKVLKTQGKNSQAREQLLSLNDPTMIYNYWSELKDFFIAEKDISLAKSLIPNFIIKLIETNQIEASDSLSVYYTQILDYINYSKDEKALATFWQDNPKIDSSSPLNYNLMLIYLTFEDFDKAFEYLEKLLDAELISYQRLIKDDQFNPFKERKRWSKVEKKAQKIWKDNSEKRKTKLLADRFDKVAPEWELEDSNGKTVTLSKLKGKVIILDFWATWCGPCRMAMPALDTWMKEDMPKNVQVFSINIFENAPEKAKTYFSDNNFRMKLLFGNEEIANAYGVKSIPYICVIDKEGKLAYEQLGFSFELEDKINTWVQALIKE